MGIAAAICFGFITVSFSAPFTSPSQTYVHRVWQTDDGIPNPMVRAVLQASDGYLWVATDEGLMKFDGVRFTEIERKDGADRPMRWFVALAETKEGIWSSSVKGGLLLLQNGKRTHYTTNDGLLNSIVLCVKEDSKGRVWIGTAAGLNEFKDGQFISYTNETGLIVEAVRAILEDRSGRLWIGTAKGLSCLADGKFTSYTKENLLVNDAVSALHEDSAGRLWIGTSGGLTCVDKEILRHYTVKNGLAHNYVRAIYEDADKNLWIGSQGGLQQLTGGVVHPVVMRDPMDPDFESIAFVYTLCADREQNIWVGNNLGLHRLHQQSFLNYTKENGLPHNVTTCIFEDSRGTIWVGTFGGGVAAIRGDVIDVFNTDNGLASNHVLSVHEDPEGAIWIGTDGAGVQRLKDGVFSHFRFENPQANVVRAIYSSHGTNLWLGGNLGVGRLVEGRFQSEPQLTLNTIKSITQDVKGRMWFAGETLLHLGEQFTRSYKRADGFLPEAANVVYADADPTFWIGTESGLYCYRNRQFFTFTNSPVLTDSRILHITEDDQGALWLSTKNGVMTAKRDELLAFTRGKVTSVNVQQFGKSDGMRRAQCNGIGSPAGWKTRNNRIWFPTMHGVLVFDPRAVKINQHPPQVTIETVTFGGERYGGRSMEFKPSRGQLEFAFTALSFTAPEKLQFKYMLRGVDRDWVDAGSGRTAIYNQLEPGDYEFRVIACNNDGVWNKTGASVSFKLRPHFYQTTWFYSLVGVGLIAGAVSFNWLRVQRSKHREQELMEMVDLHTSKFRKAIRSMESFNYSIAHDFRAPLRAIKGLTEALTEDYAAAFDETARDYAGRIHRAVDRMDGLIDDLLTYGRITHKDFESAVVNMQAVVTNAISGLEHDIEEKKAVIEVASLPAVLGNDVLMLQVVGNLVSNSLKFVAHGVKPRIRIWAECYDTRAKIYFRDNGIGIDPRHHEKVFGMFERLHSADEYPGTGIGLAIVHKAVEQMNGQIGLSSQAGQGTCFWLDLPLASAPPPAKSKSKSSGKLFPK